MPIHDKNMTEEEKIIHSLSKRELRFFSYVIHKKLGARLDLNEDQAGLTDKIYKFCDKEKVKKLIFEIRQDFANNALKDSEFSWIKKSDPRTFYFVWISTVYKEVIEKPYRPRKPLKMLKNSSSGYIEEIIFLYDILQMSIPEKEYELSCLKSKASINKNFKHKIIKNFDNMKEEELTWLWNYLTERFSMQRYMHKPLEEKFLPGFILAHIDLWNKSDAEKTVILDKAYSAMHQKKFKSKADVNKGKTLWVSAEDNQKITKLEEKLKENRKILIKRLIAQEYSKIVGN